ncbi:MAG: heat-inducible transcriptional repressor HrcA, partial [Leptolyngbya sp. SIO4C5]|nr:heat-inducible transcriptional repressor HrcA [Leptolyngbya sp. SIO4C5]
MKLKLNTRQQQILWATIRRYVETAEPVGSKSLAKEYDLKVSSATIRNAMGFLEKSGLLYQPHTSAGRIPSDSGYRIYVDELIQPSGKIGRQVDRLLRSQLDWEGWSLEALLHGAAQILSTLSGYVTLITLPNTHQAVLRHLQLVQEDCWAACDRLGPEGHRTGLLIADGVGGLIGGDLASGEACRRM